ncbi:MAG: endonuclease/exonuclease/phosphatase family protein [Bacteroidota bacterium]
MRIINNVRRLWIILFLSMISHQMFSQTEVEKGLIRMMSYNIKFDDTRDSVNNWDRRKANVIGLLTYHAPALFGIQEGLHHQLEDIKSGLSEFDYLGVGRDDGKQKGEYSALFYDTKLFKLLRSGTFWLSKTSEVPSKDWDAALPRICTWAELKLKDSENTFFVFNTHFDHVGKVARQESIKVIIQKIKALAGENPVVLMGDFNFTPQAKPYQLITEFMKDTYTISKLPPYGPEATFNGFQFLKKPQRRIDYLFVKGNIEVTKYAALSDSRDMKYPSDHFPVVADLKIHGLVE